MVAAHAVDEVKAIWRKIFLVLHSWDRSSRISARMIDLYPNWWSLWVGLNWENSLWDLMTIKGLRVIKLYTKGGNVHSKDKVEGWFPKSRCFYSTQHQFFYFQVVKWEQGRREPGLLWNWKATPECFNGLSNITNERNNQFRQLF